MKEVIFSILKKNDFINRYQQICANHNNFDSCMSTTDKKSILQIFRTIDPNVKYLSPDRFYELNFVIVNYSIDFCLKLHNGIIEPFFIIGKTFDDWWRFDFLCEEMDNEYDRKLYNLPKYSSYDELRQILLELYHIFDDIKKYPAGA
jgi:hypothetical protein